MIKYYLNNRSGRAEAEIVVKLGTNCNLALYEESCRLRGTVPSVKILDYLVDVEFNKPPKDGWFVLPEANIEEYGERGIMTVLPGVDYSYLRELDIRVDVVLNLFQTTETVIVSDLVDGHQIRSVYGIPESHFLYEECAINHTVIPAETLELILDNNDPTAHKLILMGIKPKEVINYASREFLDNRMHHITNALKTPIDWVSVRNFSEHARFITVL